MIKYKSEKKNYFLISIITFVFYSYILFTDFVGDDSIRITNIKSFMDLGWNSFMMASMPDRPVLSFSIFINYILFGISPFSFKLISLVIHILNTCLIFKISKRVFERAKVSIDEKYLVLGVLLFSLAPINYFAIHSVIQRGVLLSTLFGLLSLNCYISYIEQGKRKILLGASFLIMLGVLSKPNVLIFLVLAFIILKLVYKVHTLKLLKILLPNLIYTIYPLVLLKVVGINASALTKYTSIEYFLYQIEHIYRYVFYYLWPFNLRFIHNYDVKNIFLSSSTYFFAFTHIFTLIYSYVKRKEKSVLSFLILLFYVSLLPESSFLAIKHTFFEHRFYVPSIFLSIGIVYFGYRYKNDIIRLFLCGLCLYFGVLLISQIYKTRDLYTFEKNNYIYNKSDFNIYSTFLSVTIDMKKMDDSLKVLKDWSFDSSYNSIREIYIGLVNIETLDKKRKMALYNSTLDYLQNDILSRREKFHSMFYLFIKKVIFDTYLVEYEDINSKVKVDRALVPISAIICKNPVVYKVIIKNHIDLLYSVLKH
jgi:4-amino-4-deoxy-L-arabinose transferase-like glycosyltransferase